MKRQATQLSRAEKMSLAEYLSGKSFSGELDNPMPPSAYCAPTGRAWPTPVTGATWNGWGVTLSNTRFQPAAAAGIQPQEVPRLKLKWAFGFPGDSSSSAQPVVFGGRVFVGSWGGFAYALDAKTGCIHWAFATEGGIRNAATIAEVEGRGLTVFFGDLQSTVYAIDAATGRLHWKTRVEDIPINRITGSLVFRAGRLYVPVASREESQAGRPGYECCKARGSLVALNAASGKQIWKTYMTDEPRPTQKNSEGVQQWGPSGVGIWSAPTLDPERGAIYVATGNVYSLPDAPTADAVVALDMRTGKIRWQNQLTKGDVWNGSCQPQGASHANCPEGNGPDFDFGASPILVARDGARRSMLIAGQKSGIVYALDPDKKGALIWQQRVGRGGVDGGIEWGPAVDAERVYAAIDDTVRGNPAVGGGLFALDLRDGQTRWSAPAPGCGKRSPCSPAQAAAVTVIPGVVFSGSVDGHLRAYSAHDGAIVWDYDTAQTFRTVNGVNANGGSISGAGPTVAGGWLFATSGYSHHAGIMPGNVLLAFSVD